MNTRDQGDEYFERGSPRHRYARRSASNHMPILIALGAAAVVCVVVFFVISGSSDATEELAMATEVFRQVVEASLVGDEAAGMKLVDPRTILAQYNQKDLKRWNSDLPPERKKELTLQAWRTVQTTVLTELNIDAMDVFVSRLSAATGEARPVSEEVIIRFPYLGNEWHALISTRTGKLKRLSKS